jgi:hypothetical protein
MPRSTISAHLAASGASRRESWPIGFLAAALFMGVFSTAAIAVAYFVLLIVL